MMIRELDTVTSHSKTSGVVATRYVRAFIDLAQDSKVLDKVEKDFSELEAMVTGSDDFKHLIRSPLIGSEKQITAIEAVASQAKFHDLTKNFLRVLVQNRRLSILEGAFATFKAELSKLRGEVAVSVQTAQDLSAKQLKALEDALKKQTGTDVAINARVKPEILGGMIVTIGSHMIDDSVARKLERLRSTMGANTNENTNSTLSEVS